eukprot:8865645-Lingulodinium_polyedra.AAC.1
MEVPVLELVDGHVLAAGHDHLTGVVAAAREMQTAEAPALRERDEVRGHRHRCLVSQGQLHRPVSERRL